MLLSLLLILLFGPITLHIRFGLDPIAIQVQMPLKLEFKFKSLYCIQFDFIDLSLVNTLQVSSVGFHFFNLPEVLSMHVLCSILDTPGNQN